MVDETCIRDNSESRLKVVASELNKGWGQPRERMKARKGVRMRRKDPTGGLTTIQKLMRWKQHTEAADDG